MSDDLIFPVADMLCMPLHEVEGGIIRGFKEQMLKSSGLTLVSEIMVISDFVGTQSSGMLVRLVKNLWAYVVTYRTGSTMGNMLYTFDGQALGLSPATIKTFGTGSINDTLAKISENITCAFTFDSKTNKWSATDVDLDLDTSRTK